MSNMINPGDMVKYDDLYPGMVVRMNHDGVSRVDTIAAYSHDAKRGAIDVVFPEDRHPLLGAPESFEFEVIYCPEYVYRYYEDKPRE